MRLLAAFAVVLVLLCDEVRLRWMERLDPSRAVAAAMAVRPLGSPFLDGSCVPVRCEPMLDGSFLVKVLTARHVVAPGGPLTMTLPEGPVDALDVEQCPDADVALVRFRTTQPVTPVPMGDGEFGEDVWAAGFGSGDYWISRGILSGTNKATAPVAPGDSGGGLFDARGQLVGIISQIGLDRSVSPVPQLVVHHDWIVATGDVRGWLAGRL